MWYWSVFDPDLPLCQLEAAQAEREAGNLAYKAGNYDRAEAHYRMAAQTCDKVLSLEEEEHDAADRLKVR